MINCQAYLQYTHLVLDSTKETWLLFGGLTALVENGDDLQASGGLMVEGRSIAYVGLNSTGTGTSKHVVGVDEELAAINGDGRFETGMSVENVMGPAVVKKKLWLAICSYLYLFGISICKPCVLWTQTHRR